MKGRCSGVSLLHDLYVVFVYKQKESLPGASKYLYCSRIRKKREAPHCICHNKGSLTVEASVILPLFACFFAFVLFYFRIMQVQLIVQEALEETGRNLAVLSVKELEEPAEEPGYLTLAKGMLSLKLKDEELIAQYVNGGALGVSLLTSEFEGDYISLNANYVMRLPVRLFGIQDFLICQKTRFRKWIGWHETIGSGSAAELVYVTEYGEVYHMRRSCAYLDLSVQEIAYVELGARRNYNGEAYEACELCGEGVNIIACVYITDYGNRYHSTLTCGGLKRTIYQKQLSEVGGMPACMKCSK